MHTFISEPVLGAGEKLFENTLPGLVVYDQVMNRIAFRGGIFGVGPDVEVEPSTIAKKDVAAASPRHNSSEKVAGDLVRAEATLAVQRARDAVLVLDSEDTSLHVDNLTAVDPERGQGRPWDRWSDQEAGYLRVGQSPKCSTLGSSLQHGYFEIIRCEVSLIACEGGNGSLQTFLQGW